jgi:hypothetical protein
MRKSEQYVPLTTRITLPQIKSANWQLGNKLASQPLPAVQIGDDGQAGFTLSIQPGDCMLYEVRP